MGDGELLFVVKSSCPVDIHERSKLTTMIAIVNSSTYNFYFTSGENMISTFKALFSLVLGIALVLLSACAGKEETGDAFNNEPMTQSESNPEADLAPIPPAEPLPVEQPVKKTEQVKKKAMKKKAAHKKAKSKKKKQKNHQG